MESYPREMVDSDDRDRAWHYYGGGKAHGPFTESEIHDLYINGKITAETLIFENNVKDRVSYKDFFLNTQQAEDMPIPPPLPIQNTETPHKKEKWLATYLLWAYAGFIVLAILIGFKERYRPPLLSLMPVYAIGLISVVSLIAGLLQAFTLKRMASKAIEFTVQYNDAYKVSYFVILISIMAGYLAGFIASGLDEVVVTFIIVTIISYSIAGTYIYRLRIVHPSNGPMSYRRAILIAIFQSIMAFAIELALVIAISLILYAGISMR